MGLSFPVRTIEVQLDLLHDAAPVAVVPGLTYIPEYIDRQQEADLIRIIDIQPWITELKRRVQHYGYRYDYKARSVTPESYLGPLPEWLVPYCDRLRADGHFPQAPDQVIVNEYQPGQGIAPHIDCVPCFTDTIASLSLGSTCVMEFTHTGTQQKIPVLLEPRSLVVLSGDARYRWQHAIPYRKTDRHQGQGHPDY
ncbi:MAG: alpha-ketoglutarate-dependent dioxygenase AlkB [Pseudomonadota bacterium]|nr:alpha-ketoglutarate-dependent dioxygenase AlkB [Pseudomonadota bacterium]MDE3037564.1 alpha-ketoglutarate-dependent dioxygenase AlkB [Pseudomonadota bacterium]